MGKEQEEVGRALILRGGEGKREGRREGRREVRNIFQEVMSLVWNQLNLRWEQGLEVECSVSSSREGRPVPRFSPCRVTYEGEGWGTGSVWRMLQGESRRVQKQNRTLKYI